MKIGNYDVQVTPRANCRRMILHYKGQEGRFALSVPKGTPQRVIRAFLTAQWDWMAQQAGAPAAWQPSYAPGEQHCLLGRFVTLGREVPAGAEFLRLREKLLTETIMKLLRKWSPIMGVTVTHVTLREMSSRWGSCRPKTGRLTFNMQLAHYEEALIEETVVHELCHFFHADHSAAFYAAMTRYLPDWKTRKAARTRQDVTPRPPQGA